MALKIGKLLPNKSVLLLCDMQDKFSKIIQHFDQVVETSGKLADFAKLLNINTYVTEHYPKGLGRTVLPLKEKIGNAQYFEKTLFSMCTQEVLETLKSKNPDCESFILCGIEAHACVLATCLDLLSEGKEVHIIVDAVSSRNLSDRKYAFERMKQSGAFLTTSESIMFQLIKNANNPKFKEMQKLIKFPSPDTSLLKI